MYPFHFELHVDWLDINPFKVYMLYVKSCTLPQRLVAGDVRPWFLKALVIVHLGLNSEQRSLGQSQNPSGIQITFVPPILQLSRSREDSRAFPSGKSILPSLLMGCISPLRCF